MGAFLLPIFGIPEFLQSIPETILSETIWKCLKLFENVWNYFVWK
jgi:hypothetical protein